MNAKESYQYQTRTWVPETLIDNLSKFDERYSLYAMRERLIEIKTEILESLLKNPDLDKLFAWQCEFCGHMENTIPEDMRKEMIWGVEQMRLFGSPEDDGLFRGTVYKRACEKCENLHRVEFRSEPFLNNDFDPKTTESHIETRDLNKFAYENKKPQELTNQQLKQIVMRYTGKGMPKKEKLLININAEISKRLLEQREKVREEQVKNPSLLQRLRAYIK